MLVVEGVGPLEAVKRSASLLKKTWGEQIVGNFSIGVVFGLLMVLIIVLFIPIFFLVISSGSVVFIAAAVLVFVLLLVLMGLMVFQSPSDGLALNQSRETPVVRAVRQVSPAVVNISSAFESRKRRSPFSGFGFDSFFEDFFKDFMDHLGERKDSISGVARVDVHGQIIWSDSGGEEDLFVNNREYFLWAEKQTRYPGLPVSIDRDSSVKKIPAV